MPLVDGNRTPLTMAEVAAMMCEAYRLELGVRPTAEEVSMASGVIAAENANGKAIVMHNYGNISAGPAWRAKKDYWAAPSAIPGQPVAYRAYGSHLEGARAWWALLYKEDPDRYRVVVEALKRGDPHEVSSRLYSSGYIVGEPGVEQYGKNIASGAKKVSQTPELAACARKPGRGENLVGGIVAAVSLAGLVAVVVMKGKRNGKRLEFAA